jgi:plasmid stabilization system protein ParE
MIHRAGMSRRADREIEAAADWWAEHGSPAQAARWYAGFSAAIDSLAENPERCLLARENGLVPFEIRELHHELGPRPTHRAVFTIRPDAVLILTIRHAAQADLTEDDLP